MRERLKTAKAQLTEETAKFKAIAKPSEEEDRKQHEKKLEDLKADVKKFNEQIEKGQDPLLGFEGAGPDAAEGRHSGARHSPFGTRSDRAEMLGNVAGTA